MPSRSVAPQQIAPVGIADGDVGDSDEGRRLDEELGDADGRDDVDVRRFLRRRCQASAEEEPEHAEHDAEPGHVDGGVRVERCDTGQQDPEGSQ